MDDPSLLLSIMKQRLSNADFAILSNRYTIESNKPESETEYDVLRNLYNSVDELLAPETLSHLTGKAITSVQCAPYGPQTSYSGSRFTTIATNGEQQPSYMLKQIDPERDWLMRYSNDRLCRSVTLWHSGILDRLMPEIDAAVVACAQDENGWAILMHDISAGILSGRRINLVQHKQLLDALAAFHATFWESPELQEPALGIASHRDVLMIFLVETSVKDPCSFSQDIIEGWPILLERVDADVASILTQLMDEPQPLCNALGRYPFTLLHGDWRGPNLCLKPNSQMDTVVIDWQLATIGAATMDLIWYLRMSEIDYGEITEEESIAYYRQCLARRLGARFDDSWWQPMLELALLDHIVREGASHARGTVYSPDERERIENQQMVQKFNQEVRNTTRWL